ncbi:response regulator transcription factor [Nocardioides cavernae]|uniref:Response regulator transcription factor n=1 Tax=Nocardioides cavernae TaxID=1921566 RepID=A0ABR8N7R8_9ACTN|nr:helix-turn-helix transcriptional regulator [Nocardioides cavernae]MBD3923250.1 response regulator transcription factor [Nocardioides cavernae]MBM7511829.1 DNA-binding NarL/FixJ family response regulator [Nocardioides cavernae]
MSRATDHFARGDWQAAYDAWSRDGLDDLTATELDRFSTAVELVGHHDEVVRVLQLAFLAHRDAGDLNGAVGCAFRLAMSTAAHGEPALAGGWAARAGELVEEIGEDCVERGWLAFLTMFRALGEGDLATAGSLADEAHDAGRRFHDADLLAMSTCAQGRVSIMAGRFGEGLAQLDDAMVRVVSGETSPFIAGHVYCTAIEGVQEISDFGRAAEWTTALERWCAAQPGLLAFTGQCAVHRGQLMRLRGAWDDALREYASAADRYLAAGTPAAIGLTAIETGDLMRLRGSLEEADAAYQRAADLGVDPQPGLALLWLAGGRGTAALAAVERLLAPPDGPVQRCRLLPAAIEVLLATGDVDRARSLALELSSLASSVGATALAAAAAQALGAVELEAGDAAGALPYLRKAHQLWAQSSAQYDAAVARLLIGRCLLALSDRSSAERELTAARASFRHVGAQPMADLASSLLAPASLPAGLTARELEVLRLVASGRSNSQIAAELVLSEKTVARHLSNIFGKLEVGSRTAAAAYAFEHGLV